MMRLEPRPSLELGEARHRLEKWRQRRQRGERIPGPLWAEAAGLARAQGVSLVARTLGLDYFGLKRRVKAVKLGSPSPGAPPPGFVELPLVGSFGPAVSCTVELARSDGGRMTIHWGGQPGQDLVGMAEAFWRPGR